MKINKLSVYSLSLMVILSSFAVVFAQRDDRSRISAASNMYVISATAGGVNFVEGKVAVTRKEAKSGYLLKGDSLKIGDQVATGEDGKAEILLNPGSFVRLGENSNFEFLTTSLDDLHLKLNRGSAMFEVITDAEFGFTVKTPKTEFNITKSGIYRVDVLADGTSKIEVWKGKANANNTEIKGGKQATVGEDDFAVVKFDRDEKDSLELWSKNRAKTLAKINSQLQNSQLRTSLMSSFFNSSWNMYQSYGLWVYNPFYGSYCFLPFGYGWNSPYGYYYRRDIWHYNLPPVIYTHQPTTTNNNPMPRLNGNNSAANGPIRNSRNTTREAPVERIRPPYSRVQRDVGQFPVERQSESPMFPVFIPSGSVQQQQQQQPVLSAPSGPIRRGGN